MFYYIISQEGECELTPTTPICGYVKSIIDFSFSAHLNTESINDLKLLLVESVSRKEIIQLSIDNNILRIENVVVDKNASKYFWSLYRHNDKNDKELLVSFAFMQVDDIPQVTFVVGSPRSGTTALGNGLNRAYLAQGHGEAHVGEWLRQLEDITVSHFSKSAASKAVGTLTYDVTNAQVRLELFNMLRVLHGTFYLDRIIDKTPGNEQLKSLLTLMTLYPQAKVLFCKRRGLENVSSRMKKWPNVEFEAHCRQWTICYRLWSKVKNDVSRQLLNNNWFYEVEQLNLLRGDESTIDSIANFLHFNREEKRRFIAYNMKYRPQKTSSSDVPISLKDLDWTQYQKTFFVECCGEMMVNQNYSLDESYFISC